MTAVVVIPARYHSSRLPGKPLADIGGRPMIEHVYRRASRATRAGSVMVATDDPRIRDVVTGFGGEARLTDGAHRNGMERLAEIARDLACELVVNVQGDEPLIAPASIDLALGLFDHTPDLLMSTLRAPLAGPDDFTDPHVVKVVIDQRGDALYFSRAAIPHGGASAACKHIGLYVYRRAFLLTLASLEPRLLERTEGLEQLRALEHGYRIRTVETRDDSIGVDTPDDLERVRRLVTSGAV